MKFDKLVVGMQLFDAQSQKMGNTTIRTISVYTVTVREIDTEKRRALCSWNGNTPKWFYEPAIAKLKDKRPVLIQTAFGSKRRPTKAELAEIRAKEAASAAEKIAQSIPAAPGTTQSDAP